MNKKIVLFIHHVTAIGGGSYCLLNILKNLDRVAIEPIVLTRCPGPLSEEIKNLGISVDFIPEMGTLPTQGEMFKFGTWISLIRILQFMPIFEKYLRSNKIDKVYLNTLALAHLLLTTKKLGIKSVIHIREHGPVGKPSILFNYIRGLVEKYADNVIAVNNYSASLVKKVSPLIIYDGIDFANRQGNETMSDIFKEDCSGLKVFICTGGVQPIKGTLEVVRVFREHLTSSEYRLLLIGVAKGEMKGRVFDNYYRQICALVQQDSRIKCIPGTYRLKNLFEEAYCNLSYFTVPHANLVLVENIICNTPSVAARTPESIEYSFNESLSILFEINNYQSFMEAIDKLLAHYDEISQRICRYSSKVQDMFALEINSRRINELLVSDL